MNNPKKGEVDIHLDDGRDLRLVFNANTWIALEDWYEERGTPKSTPQIIDGLQSGQASMKEQRALMYFGLKKHQPTITEEEAGEILLEAAEQMAKAISGGLPNAGAQPDATEGEGSAADASEGPPSSAGTTSATPGLA